MKLANCEMEIGQINGYIKSLETLQAEKYSVIRDVQLFVLGYCHLVCENQSGLMQKIAHKITDALPEVSNRSTDNDVLRQAFREKIDELAEASPSEQVFIEKCEALVKHARLNADFSQGFLQVIDRNKEYLRNKNDCATALGAASLVFLASNIVSPLLTLMLLVAYLYRSSTNPAQTANITRRFVSDFFVPVSEGLRPMITAKSAILLDVAQKNISPGKR